MATVTCSTAVNTQSSAGGGIYTGYPQYVQERARARKNGKISTEGREGICIHPARRGSPGVVEACEGGDPDDDAAADDDGDDDAAADMEVETT